MAIVTLRPQGRGGSQSSGRPKLDQLLDAGFVAIDKPVGPSSHEVSAYVQRILGISKSGHTGTLDPNVSGVLVVLLDSSCKMASFLQETDKSYVCVMETGKAHTRDEIESAFENFRGKIYQTPPVASAVARRLRVREIYSLEILEISGRRVLFKCDCEAGTYIRKLCEDAGRVLASGASMVELRRTKAMGIGEEDAITLQKLSDCFWLYKEKSDDSALRSCIRPIEELATLKKAVISDEAIAPLLKGMDVKSESLVSVDDAIKKGDYVSVMNENGELLAVAKALADARDIIDGEKLVAFDVERLIRTTVMR